MLDQIKDIAQIIALIGIPLAVAIVGARVNVAVGRIASRSKLIELAVQVLRTDPKDHPGNRPLRAWAVEVLAKYSEVPIPSETLSTLYEYPILPRIQDSIALETNDFRYLQFIDSPSEHSAANAQLAAFLSECWETIVFRIQRTNQPSGWLIEGSSFVASTTESSMEHSHIEKIAAALLGEWQHCQIQRITRPSRTTKQEIAWGVEYRDAEDRPRRVDFLTTNTSPL